MRIFIASLIAALSLSATAHAGDIAVYGGEFSIFNDSGKDNTEMFGLEYRFKDQFNGLRPTIGGFYNTKGATYGYAGAYWDLPLNTGPFVISPGVAAGYYNRGGSKELGYDLEFRSTLEITYKLEDGQRLGHSSATSATRRWAIATRAWKPFRRSTATRSSRPPLGRFIVD